MCRLDIRAVALTTGIVSGVLALICTWLVAWHGPAFMGAMGYLTHIDLGSLDRPLTVQRGLAGLVFWTLVPAAISALAASLYNALVPETRLTHSWLPEEETVRTRPVDR